MTIEDLTCPFPKDKVANGSGQSWAAEARGSEGYSLARGHLALSGPPDPSPEAQPDLTAQEASPWSPAYAGWSTLATQDRTEGPFPALLDGGHLPESL